MKDGSFSIYCSSRFGQVGVYTELEWDGVGFVGAYVGGFVGEIVVEIRYYFACVEAEAIWSEGVLAGLFLGVIGWCGFDAVLLVFVGGDYSA